MAKYSEAQVEAAVVKMMRGSTPVELALAGIASKQKLIEWHNNYCVATWREIPVLTDLLYGGLFHVTGLKQLAGIVDDREIRPSGSVESTFPTMETIAAALNAVALFDVNAARLAQACMQSAGLAVSFP